MANKISHLELITQAINRMAANSSMMKGWSLTLIVGLIALAQKDSNQNFIYIALLPSISFWILDVKYLATEIAFRNLYNKVRKIEDGKIDFSMNIKPYQTKKNCKKAFCSWSTYYFHSPVLIILMALIIYSNWKCIVSIF